MVIPSDQKFWDMWKRREVQDCLAHLPQFAAQVEQQANHQHRPTEEDRKAREQTKQHHCNPGQYPGSGQIRQRRDQDTRQGVLR